MKDRCRAMLAQACPRCRESSPFRGLYRMDATCVTCGLAFEREPGYWLGAMYFSYGLGIACAVPLAVCLARADFASSTIVLTVLAVLALLSPLTFRMSRVMWMYLDQSVDPR